MQQNRYGRGCGRLNFPTFCCENSDVEPSLLWNHKGSDVRLQSTIWQSIAEGGQKPSRNLLYVP